jgi:DNA-binding protein H-NS
VLAGLMGKVPEQARPAIQRAMENSQKGRTTALSNLEQVRTERQERERAEMRRNEQARGAYGQHDGMGRPEGAGRASQGAGGGMGRSAGAGASQGRGPR